MIHTFGCPIFALSNVLQNGRAIPKCPPRSCLGIYLWPSPYHAQCIPRILGNSTGLYSPQFHVTHVGFFEITMSIQRNSTSVKCEVLSGLNISTAPFKSSSIFIFTSSLRRRSSTYNPYFRGRSQNIINYTWVHLISRQMIIMIQQMIGPPQISHPQLLLHLQYLI